MVGSILLDQKRILPYASSYLQGEYGHTLFVGVPVRLGTFGDERSQLEQSAGEVRKMVEVLRS